MKDLLNIITESELKELQNTDSKLINQIKEKLFLPDDKVENQSLINKRKMYKAALNEDPHVFEKLHAVTLVSKTFKSNESRNQTTEKSEDYVQLFHEYYQNVNYVLNGDEDVEFPLILADPPYNQEKDNYWDLAFDFGEMIEVFSKHLSKNGTLLIYNRAQSLDEIKSYLDENGLELIRTVYWQKPNPNKPDKNMYITDRAREYILVIKHKKTKNSDLTFNLLGTEKFKTGILNYTVDPMSKQDKENMYINFHAKKHTTVKPLQLEMELLLRHSNVGDYVWVPFAGSGVDIKACLETYRRCVAFEIDPGYVKFIQTYRIDAEITNIIDYEDEFPEDFLDTPGEIYEKRVAFLKANKIKTKNKFHFQKLKNQRIEKIKEIQKLKDEIKDIDSELAIENRT